jgi:hypothetical protein
MNLITLTTQNRGEVEVNPQQIAMVTTCSFSLNVVKEIYMSSGDRLVITKEEYEKIKKRSNGNADQTATGMVNYQHSKNGKNFKRGDHTPGVRR